MIHKIKNKITVITEYCPDLESCSFCISSPSGSLHDPKGKKGLAQVVSSSLLKGTDSFSAKQIADLLYSNGTRYNISCQKNYSKLVMSGLKDSVQKSFEIAGQILSSPLLEQDSVSDVIESQKEDVLSLEDDNRSLLSIRLREIAFNEPFNSPTLGYSEDLQGISSADVKSFYNKYFQSKNTVIGVCGKFNEDQIISQIEDVFGGWDNSFEKPSFNGVCTQVKNEHIQKDSAQVVWSLMFKSIESGHPDYYVAKVALAVLSGSMSSKLFLEVREKKGLVYTIHGSHSSNKDYGVFSIFAGTTPENAQETVDVTLEVLSTIDQTLLDKEIFAAKANLKYSLMKSYESSGARASAIVREYYDFGAIRDKETVLEEIAKVTKEQIIDFIKKSIKENYVFVSLGKLDEELKINLDY